MTKNNLTEVDKNINPKTYSIYVLTDPRKTGIESVRYVGQSMYPLRRYTQHCNPWNVNDKDNYYARWLKSLFKKGLKPKMEILVSGITDWDFEEKKWIKIFRQVGAKLVNANDGGHSTNHMRDTPNSHCYTGKTTPLHSLRKYLSQGLAIAKKKHPEDIKFWQDLRETTEIRIKMLCEKYGKDEAIYLINQVLEKKQNDRRKTNEIF